jgi:hypothetical protein
MFTLSGEQLDRLRQALAVVVHQARLGQNADYGRNVVDAMIEAEEFGCDLLARLDGALDDDRAEAEEQAVVDSADRAWHPLYRAA